MLTLADHGVTRSLSRPQVSDDNPFSEAQFKTLKYHPSFPGRFEIYRSGTPLAFDKIWNGEQAWRALRPLRAFATTCWSP